MDYVKDILRAGTQMAGNGAKCVRDTLWRSLTAIDHRKYLMYCLRGICFCGHFYVVCKEIGLTFTLMLLLRLNEVPTVNYLVENYTMFLMLLMLVIYYTLNLFILRRLFGFKSLPQVFIHLFGKLLKVLPQKTVPVGGAGRGGAGAGGAGAGRAGAGVARRAAANNHQGTGGNLNGNTQPAGNVNPGLPRRNPDRFARWTVPSRYSPQ